ncbi:MAG TPA: hypothetical protein VL853_08810, partial [Gemmatimonadales bacterium]|nr:hypothetical protein [Gemmatimonadales bacterium]
MSLELRTSKPALLVAEPYDLRLTLVNHGSGSIAVARTFYSYAKILLITEDGQVECESGNPGVKGAAEVNWEVIAPRAELALGLPAFQCLCKGDHSAGCQDWLYRPGIYKLRVVFAHHPNDAGVAAATATPPQGVVDATLESNLIEIRVNEPIGIDADALAWAESINEHPLSVNVINRFPSSTYS